MLEARMVAGGSRAGRSRRAGGAMLQAEVVDAGHVLRPLAGREAGIFLEAGEPVGGVFGPDDQECRLFFADG